MIAVFVGDFFGCFGVAFDANIQYGQSTRCPPLLGFCPIGRGPMFWDLIHGFCPLLALNGSRIVGVCEAWRGQNGLNLGLLVTLVGHY